MAKWESTKGEIVTPTERFLVEGATHPGRHKSVGEDWCGVLPLEGDACLFVVADGVSTADRSSFTAQLAIATMLRQFREMRELQPGGSDPAPAMTAAIRAADSQIAAVAAFGGSGLQLATTITACYYSSGRVTIAHLGDSPALLFDGSGLEILRFHSHVHPVSGYLTRYLGSGEPMDIEVRTVEIDENHVLVLATDGLTNGLSNADIFRIIREAADAGAGAVAERLVKAAYETQDDDITVLLGIPPPRVRATDHAGTETGGTSCPSPRLDAGLEKIGTAAVDKPQSVFPAVAGGGRSPVPGDGFGDFTTTRHGDPDAGFVEFRRNARVRSEPDTTTILSGPTGGRPSGGNKLLFLGCGVAGLFTTACFSTLLIIGIMNRGAIGRVGRTAVAFVFGEPPGPTGPPPPGRGRKGADTLVVFCRQDDASQVKDLRKILGPDVVLMEVKDGRSGRPEPKAWKQVSDSVSGPWTKLLKGYVDRPPSSTGAGLLTVRFPSTVAEHRKEQALVVLGKYTRSKNVTLGIVSEDKDLARSLDCPWGVVDQVLKPADRDTVQLWCTGVESTSRLLAIADGAAASLGDRDFHYRTTRAQRVAGVVQIGVRSANVTVIATDGSARMDSVQLEYSTTQDRRGRWIDWKAIKSGRRLAFAEGTRVVVKVRDPRYKENSTNAEPLTLNHTDIPVKLEPRPSPTTAATPPVPRPPDVTSNSAQNTATESNTITLRIMDEECQRGRARLSRGRHKAPVTYVILNDRELRITGLAKGQADTISIQNFVFGNDQLEYVVKGVPGDRAEDVVVRLGIDRILNALIEDRNVDDFRGDIISCPAAMRRLVAFAIDLWVRSDGGRSSGARDLMDGLGRLPSPTNEADRRQLEDVVKSVVSEKKLPKDQEDGIWERLSRKHH